jgi:hypothetical protein
LAAATQQYQTVFTIGAKLLSSFTGAMSQAQSRMKAMEKTVKGVSSSLKAMTGLLTTALAALGARAIFAKIFEGAEEAATAAEQRTRRMVTSMLQLRDIAARGRGYAEGQLKMLQAHTEELAKHSVYSQDILAAGEDQLAVAAVPPKYIKQAIGPMQDMLAVSKGVTATEADMAQLAKGMGVAIKTGMTKQLKEFGLILDPNQKKYLQALSKAGQYQEAYNYLLEKMKFAAGEAARLLTTPAGRIKKAQENILEMGKRVRLALLPDKAQMEEAWSNAMLSLEPILTDFEKAITHVKTWAAQEFADLVNRLKQPDAKKAATDFADAINSIGIAFGYSNQQGQSLGTMLGTFLTKEIQQEVQDFRDLERVMVKLKRYWTIFEGDFLGGWQRITEGLSKLVDLWEKFKKSITEWKPPWWMPGGAALRAGQAIYKAGAPVRAAISSAASGAAAVNRGATAGQRQRLATGEAPITAASLSTGGAALPAGKGGVGVYDKLLTAYKGSGLVGTVPPDGARFGITTGSAEEWARFGTAVASAESGFNPRSTNLTDPGGSFGVFQYAHGQVPGGNAFDVDSSVRAFVRDSQSSVRSGSLQSGILGKRFSTIGSHPDRTARRLSEAAAIAAQAAKAQPAAMQFGGIARRPMLAHLAERGAEAVIPLGRGRGGGMGSLGGTMVNFTPNITIHGGMAGGTEEGLVSRLRDLSREFVEQFKRAQAHERRLSYEGGYG